MNQDRSGRKRIEAYLLPACLMIQAALLFWRLDLLPVWGDEQFTLDTSAQPLEKIAAIVRGDIHPPLYYFLVHFWIRLPIPASAIATARAFSGLWALATTALLYRLWFRDARFFLLWTLSPCLILYGRMARSYTLQLFLACLALYWGMNLIRDPRRRGALLPYAFAGALLLYTHYLAALAIILAVEALLLYRRAWIAATMPVAIMALAYAPWILSLRIAFGRVAEAHTYAVASNRFLEHIIRLLYLAVSFTLGESLPVWVIAGGVLLAPAVAVALWRDRRAWPDWLPLVSIAAAIGYIGAGLWVSFAFVPARLLFVLPFFLALLTKRTWICVALACLSIGSLYSYFHKENYLNKGYLLPFDQIADIIKQSTGARRAQLIVEAPGRDISPLTARLPGNISLTSRADAEIVWVLRDNGGGMPLAGAREISRTQFVPFSALDRAAMKLLNWPRRPTHVLELVEYAAN